MRPASLALVLILGGCPKQAPTSAEVPPPAEPPTSETADASAPEPPRIDPAALKPAPGPAAAFAFGWEDGSEAHVVFRVEAEQIAGDATQSRTTTEATWVEQFLGSKDGHRYRMVDGAGSTLIEPPPPAASALEAVMTALTLATPETVVSDDGAFTGIDGLDGLKAEVAGQMAVLMDRMPPVLRDPLHQTLEEGLSEEAVTRDASRRWRGLVDDWRGRTLEVGKADELTDDAGRRITTRLLGWVACKPDLEARECAVIERRTDASPDEVAHAQDAIGLAVAGTWPMGEPAPRLSESEVFTLEVLVAEPGTLRPWARLERKTAHHTFKLGGRPVVYGSEIRTTTQWLWHAMGRP